MYSAKMLQKLNVNMHPNLNSNQPISMKANIDLDGKIPFSVSQDL